MKARILIIEDDEALRENLRDILSAEGYEVLTADDGQEGVKLARSRLPDLILCDILMPQMDGYSVLRELQKDPVASLIPFIYISAKVTPEDLRKGMGLGADDYLAKPFTADQLLEAVEARLEKRRRMEARYAQRIRAFRAAVAVTTLPHEFQTPLAGIVGFSEMLAENAGKLSPEEIRAMAQEIRQCAKRLEDLVDRILVYNETVALAEDPEFLRALKREQCASAGSVVEKIAREKAAAYGRQEDLRLETEDCPSALSERYLRLLAGELTDNAFKFSSPGSPVTVSFRRLEDGGALLRIQDRGRGMSPADLREIGEFVQFQRDRFEQQGAGLGLTLARGIVRLYSGEWRVESEPGRGTTAAVRLPPPQEAAR